MRNDRKKRGENQTCHVTPFARKWGFACNFVVTEQRHDQNTPVRCPEQSGFSSAQKHKYAVNSFYSSVRGWAGCSAICWAAMNCLIVSCVAKFRAAVPEPWWKELFGLKKGNILWDWPRKDISCPKMAQWRQQCKVKVTLKFNLFPSFSLPIPSPFSLCGTGWCR